jgi:MFS family permease
LRLKGTSLAAQRSADPLETIGLLTYCPREAVMRYLETQEGLPRVSWGAVFTGVTIALVAYVFMCALGAAIGATLLNPLAQQDPRAFGFGSGVWLIVTTVVAVFLGGYFAGRCAPLIGWLHGMLAWALMVLCVVVAMTSIVSGAVSFAGRVAGAGVATMQSGNAGNAVNALSQEAQSAIASMANAASAPMSDPNVRQAADTATHAVARASWFSVAALFVGFVIAVGAGSLGFRHQPVLETTRRASTVRAEHAPGRP